MRTHSSGARARVSVAAALESEVVAKMNELANARGQISVLETEKSAKAEHAAKMESELAEERGKTSALQAEVQELSSRVRHLADLTQRQQLDIEWMTGLKRDGVPTPARLMQRQQRL